MRPWCWPRQHSCSCCTAPTPPKRSGDGITETIPLDEDHDYLYDVGDYIVHLQVKDGAVAFLDSQCPDHVCEQFGWLSEQDAWAACVPAGVYVTVQAAETE